MNMKKTMAAIAAGAVAVSAMATTVSAENANTKWADKTVSFNLVRTDKIVGEGSVTLTAKFYNIPFVAGDTAVFNIPGLNDKDVVEITGRYTDNDNGTIYPIYASKDTGYANYNAAGAAGLDEKAGTFTVPVVGVNAFNGFAFVGGAANAVALPQQDAKFIVKSVITQPAAAAEAIDLAKSAANAATWDVTKVAATDTKDTEFDIIKGAQVGDLITLTYKAANTWTTAGGVDITTSGLEAALLKADGKTAATLDTNTKIQIQLTQPGRSVATNAGVGGAWTGDLTVVVKKAKLDKSITKLEEVQAAIKAGTLGIGLKVINPNNVNLRYNVQAGAGMNNSTIYASEFKDGITYKKYPYKTTPDLDLNNGGDVMDHVFVAKDNEASPKVPQYTVSNIINDAINHYDAVTFKFITTSNKIKDDAYDNDGVDKYMKGFDKNWWDLTNDQYKFDGSNYWINDWSEMSLFRGALIVNNAWTFSLAAAESMSWNGTYLMFDWDDIQANALNTNPFTSYIQTMVLRTGIDWYWDTLEVSYAEGEAESVEASAEDKADDNMIEDEEDGIEDDEDEGDEDEDEGDEDEGDEDEGDEDEDEGDEDEGDEDEGDVDNDEDQKNPKTGNPAVALAVIPVALAAAAVVAKKRG